jgi:hypothetical protein
MALAILSCFRSAPSQIAVRLLDSPRGILPSADTVAMSELIPVPKFSSADVAAVPEMISKAPSSALWLAGSSAAMTQLRGQIRRVAPYFRSALFVGEPGCGEEAAAQILHQQSPLSRPRPSRSSKVPAQKMPLHPSACSIFPALTSLLPSPRPHF